MGFSNIPSSNPKLLVPTATALSPLRPRIHGTGLIHPSGLFPSSPSYDQSRAGNFPIGNLAALWLSVPDPPLLVRIPNNPERQRGDGVQAKPSPRWRSGLFAAAECD